MIEKIHEKHRNKKLKGYKYYKNKKRNNVTIVFSDPTSKPQDTSFNDIEEYELESQTSNSICESPRKKSTTFKHFNIDKIKRKDKKDNVYTDPVITRSYSRILAKKSFDNDSALFKQPN